MKYFYQFTLSLLLTSCMTLNDSWEDLGDNYTFHRDGRWTKIYGNGVYSNTDIYSSILEYNFNDNYIIAKQQPDKEHHQIFIRSNYQSRFSIYEYYLSDSSAMKAESTPSTIQAMKSDVKLYELLKSKGVTKNNTTKDWEKIDIVLDSIFQTDPQYVKLFESAVNYWIIDKKVNKRYGPLTIEEFNGLNEQLNVSLEFKK
ncbi:MAG: DUF3997 domain-containing protein [Cyclobacteriaceae bacterium]